MKKNLFNSLILVCCILLVGISSSFAIRNLNSSYAAKHIARFYDNGGKWLNVTSTSDRQVIPYDDSLSLSDSRLKISKDGCTFGGWRRGSNSGPKVTKTSLDSSDNAVNFYAIWENCLEDYIVSFNMNGASGSIDKQTIKSGGTVRKPTNPTRTGYTFLYWSMSSNGSEYNFNSKVTSSFTLFAIWKKNEVVNPSPQPNPTPTPSPQPNPTPGPQPSVTKYNVTFNLNGGTGNIASQSIEKGGKVSIPNNIPTRDKFEFNYWSNNKNCDNEYNFDTAVNSNITLYACYLKKHNITINKTGLPFISNYIEVVLDGDNLNKFNKKYNTTIADVTTYSMVDASSCSSSFKKIYTGLSDSELIDKCNKLSDVFDCSVNKNCFSNKYIILSDALVEDVLYLKEKNVIKLEYNSYKYNGLYRDKACKKTYIYSNSIKSDLELYECFELIKENSGSVEKPSKKKGISATLVLIIIAIASVVAFVGFLFFKGKIANRVD